jgi:hypothetical protein
MFLDSKVRRVHGSDNLTTISTDCLDNAGSLTSHNPIDLARPDTGIALAFYQVT